MRHLDDGTLRRTHDEPLMLTAGQRRHLEGCDRCRSRLDTMTAGARDVELALTGAMPAFDARTALPAVRQRIGHVPAPAPWQRRITALLVSYGRQATKPLTAATAAIVVAGALFLTPAGSLASGFITIFQPKQVAVVPISTQELQQLSDLRKFGTVHAPANVPSQNVADAAAASQASGMTVLVPSSLPAGVPPDASYQVVPGATGTFTFSAAKAQEWAQDHNQTLPTMPDNVDGSTLRLTTGNGAVAMYGKSQGIPALVVGQMVAPKVESTGASVQELEDYILSLPGISPQLKTSIRAIGDPTSTLPIPVPIDKANADQVTVQGAPGLAIGDSTGVASAVIWEKDSIIYGVGGSLTESQVIDVANSLR